MLAHSETNAVNMSLCVMLFPVPLYWDLNCRTSILAGHKYNSPTYADKVDAFLPVFMQFELMLMGSVHCLLYCLAAYIFVPKNVNRKICFVEYTQQQKSYLSLMRLNERVISVFNIIM